MEEEEGSGEDGGGRNRTGHRGETEMAPVACLSSETTSLQWRARTQNKGKRRKAGGGKKWQGAVGDAAGGRRCSRGAGRSNRAIETASARQGESAQVTVAAPTRLLSRRQRCCIDGYYPFSVTL